ncbi:MAG: ABC transporter ATP-binding protein [Spirochaetales bacterium]|nr:ABC transporter ATP-binding protein [Spirochaetales bacterium]
MIKLARYLKPYIPIIIICAGLLFIQANMDLALPDYMSKIVNNGVQQSGVESVIPNVLRDSTMKKLELFMGEDTANMFSASYHKVDSSSADFSTLKEEYPSIEKEALWFINEDADLTDIELQVAKAFTAVSSIEKMAENPEAMKAMGGSMNMSQMPENMDFFTMIEMMPVSQRGQIKSGVMEKISTMDNMLLEQAAVQLVKAEYEAIGLDMGELQLGYIKKTGIVMVLVTLASIMANVLAGLFAARTAAGVSRKLRRDIFTKVESFNGEEFDRFSTASLITRTTNDITQIQLVIYMSIRMVLYAPIMGVGGVIRALGKAPSMAWLIGLAVVVLLLLIIAIFSTAVPKFKMIQKLVDRLNLVTREQLSGLMVVRAFNRQDFEEKRFDKANMDLTNINLFVTRVMAIMMPVMMLIMNVLTVAIVWVGSHKVSASLMQVGDMMAFLQYAMQIVMSFLMLSMMFIFIPRASVSGVRIAEVIDTEPSIKDPENPQKPPEQASGRIEFRNVSFKYPGGEEHALCDISFTAEPGQTTAIIGSTGSGKSSIVNLIPRFYDASEGEVLVDGIDVKDLTQKDLRAQIGYVPQKVNLFTGTIKSNIKYGNENATDQQLLDAAETAQAMEFIKDKPEGLDTPISQGGQNVSGGQKQRISIARALVKEAPVYIFDDSFSALDFKTDAALRRALKEKSGGSTLIIVAQRVSTIMKAEQILVMDEGKIVGKGTHQQLMAECEEYKEIVYSQLSMEELS